MLTQEGPQAHTGESPPHSRAPRRYLVTGGLGYVGAWITSALAADGHESFVLSRKTDKPELKSNPAPQAIQPQERSLPYTLIQADLAEQSPAELAAILPQKLDALVHAAGFTESFTPGYAQKALSVNALGTRNLLEALVLQSKELLRPLPLFLYVGTFHVYGASRGHITENSPLRPQNDYALTHLFAEEYCRMFMRTNKLPQIIVRLSNGYGAPKTAAGAKWHLLLNDLCKSAFCQGRLFLRSDPAVQRDFVWLGDVAAIVKELLTRPDLAGRIFNLSSGVALTIGEVARRVSAGAARALHKDVPLVLEQAPTSGEAGLRVDNRSVRAALKLGFHDRMDEEIARLFCTLAAEQHVGI